MPSLLKCPSPELCESIRTLHAQGLLDSQIAERCGRCKNYVLQVRKFLGLVSNYKVFRDDKPFAPGEEEFIDQRAMCWNLHCKDYTVEAIAKEMRLTVERIEELIALMPKWWGKDGRNNLLFRMPKSEQRLLKKTPKAKPDAIPWRRRMQLKMKRYGYDSKKAVAS